jgi:hypothetical protein
MNLKMLFVVGSVVATILNAPAANADDLTPEYEANALASYLMSGSSQTIYTLGANFTESAPYSSASVVSSLAVPAFEVSGSSAATPVVYPDPLEIPYEGGASQAGIHLDYFYDVTGAVGAVPVDVAYDIEATSTSSGPYSTYTASEAYIRNFVGYLDEFDNDYVVQSGYSSQTKNTTKQLEGVFSTTVGSQASEIDLYVFEETEGGIGSYSTAEAYADPRIYIDPAYLAAHPGATLHISPGIGNIGPTSAVPEPSLWAFMLAGVGMTGARLRLSRRHRARTGAWRLSSQQRRLRLAGLHLAWRDMKPSV